MVVISASRNADGTAPGLMVAVWHTTVSGAMVHREETLCSFASDKWLAPCIPCTLARLESVQECKVCIG